MVSEDRLAFHTSFPPYGVAADLVVLTLDDGGLKVLLVERNEEPFAGRWALPGGFIDKDGRDPNLEETAYRELQEETGLTRSDVRLEQLKAYWSRGRDPRALQPDGYEVLAVAWLALSPVAATLQAGSDASSAAWVGVSEALDAGLAFDHSDILRDGIARTRELISDVRVAASLLPAQFTVSQLRRVYETIWGAALVGEPAEPSAPFSLDRPNFQRRVLKLTQDGVLRKIETPQGPWSVTGRSSQMAFELVPDAALPLDAPRRIDPTAREPLTKRIVILANAPLDGGRLVAGIELVNGWPNRWVRLVADDHATLLGDTDVMLPDGDQPRTLDVVDVPLVGRAPMANHTENWICEPGSAWGRRPWRIERGQRRHFEDRRVPLWLADDTDGSDEVDDQLTVDGAAKFTDSIRLIRVHDLRLTRRDVQVESQFAFLGTRYRLPVIDPDAIESFMVDNDSPPAIGEAYLTVALTAATEDGGCRRVVAAAIPL